MARGRRAALSLEEQLVKITEDIENLESSLKELKQTKRDLEVQIRQNNLAELDRVIAEKGFTFEQVMEMLNGGKDK